MSGTWLHGAAAANIPNGTWNQSGVQAGSPGVLAAGGHRSLHLVSGQHTRERKRIARSTSVYRCSLGVIQKWTSWLSCSQLSWLVGPGRSGKFHRARVEGDHHPTGPTQGKQEKREVRLPSPPLTYDRGCQGWATPCAGTRKGDPLAVVETTAHVRQRVLLFPLLSSSQHPRPRVAFLKTQCIPMPRQDSSSLSDTMFSAAKENLSH